MAALIGIPPCVTTAFVQIDQNMGASVTPCQGDTCILDRLKILIFFGLGAGGYMMVVAASHGDDDAVVVFVGGGGCGGGGGGWAVASVERGHI